MKVSVTVGIERDGRATELVLTKDDEGVVRGFVPAGPSKARAEFIVHNPDELIQAGLALRTTEVSVFPGGIPEVVGGQLKLDADAARAELNGAS